MMDVALLLAHRGVYGLRRLSKRMKMTSAGYEFILPTIRAKEKKKRNATCDHAHKIIMKARPDSMVKDFNDTRESRNHVQR
jgi:hypothetical protein